MMSSGRFQIQRLQRGAAIIPYRPPPPPGAASPPGWVRPQTAAGQSMHGLAAINALISSFLVCSSDKRVPRDSLVTFCKYCWCSPSAPATSFSARFCFEHKIQNLWTWLACRVRCEPSARQVLPAEIRRKRRARKWVAIKIAACRDVLSLADKTVIQCYAEDSRNPLRHKHLLVTHRLLAHLHMCLSRICLNY